ncbi:hypothetical protein MTO96_015877 [Rhipicephalus appendiculatus]
MLPQPRDRSSIFIGSSQSSNADSRAGVPLPTGGGTLGRPRPSAKPQIAEKPTTLQRRSLEGVVEGGATVAGGSYSTQSLERRPGRHQVAGVVMRPQPCERPSVPPTGATQDRKPREREPQPRPRGLRNFVARCREERRRDGPGRRGSGERPLSLDHQEMLSFADESDSEDGSSVLVSPSGNGSNGPNVMWKSCIASLPGDDHSTGPVLLRRSPSKTNGVAPERPPATTDDVCLRRRAPIAPSTGRRSLELPDGIRGAASSRATTEVEPFRRHVDINLYGHLRDEAVEAVACHGCNPHDGPSARPHYVFRTTKIRSIFPYKEQA